MKIKCLFLTALLLTVTTIGFAQAKKPTTKTTANTPEQVVKDLYAAAKNEKTNPFDQTSRVLVDKYFTKEFADLIWKTIKTEDGWRHIDALYDSHAQLRDSEDPQITNFVVGAPKEDGSPDNVFVKVTFKNHGEAASSGFKLRRESNKTWKIDAIEYGDGDDLASTLRFATDAEYQKEYDADTFQGDYMVGAMQCRIERTMSSIELYRVTCDGQKGFKLYAVEGDEKQTAYIYTDDKGKQQGKFVFKNGEKDGKFFDAAGKQVKVSRIAATSESDIPKTPESDSENEPVFGELMIGKTESVILYVGEETGDYAAYCFTNASEAGRAILAKCKNKDRCEVTATLGDGGSSCKVPGLEATLSASFRILKVASVKSLGRGK